ncbi:MULTISPECIES: restriction endonuclease subunit S [Cobetia]|uniref:restriction endonuclease subunit S n=1 Tax=Cobetia TaxID=204286 RepID=UPI001C053240|nr:restriction endonuclease subunit S [Cobetia sp. 4B]QWN38079.1 restriction endonuclease subunit S [Cobetia sp. 4B]
MSVQKLITDHLDLWTSAVTHKNGSGRNASGKNGKIELTGIKKLRELILELAVRGKLVEQDPSDEPASVLLERVAEEKARLVKDGKIKKPRKLHPLTDANKPFSLPERWEWTQIEAVGHDWGQKEPDRVFSYIDVSSIDNIKGIIDQPEAVSPSNAPSRARKKVRQNTVVYSTVRPYLKNIAVIDKKIEPEPIASTAFAIVSPLSGIPAKYLLHYLRSPVFVRYVESVQTGIAYPAINDKQFFSGALPVPPLQEQHRIVEKVDELMALCDRLEQQVGDQLEAHEALVDTLLDALTRSTDAAELAENWARVAEHFDTLFTTEDSIEKLKQTILQLAVMGRLVEQNSNDEPAIHFLNRYGIEGKPYFLSGWTEVALGNLGEIIGGSTPTKSNAAFWEGDIPWVSPKDMKLPVIQDSQNKVTEKALQQKTLKKVPKNSLLMVVRGMILAHSFPVAINGLEVTINQDMKALVPPKEISPYLLLYLQAEKQKLVGLVDRSSHGTCKLVSEKLWSHVVYLPPIEEQARIIETVDELMALCDRLKARLSEAGETRAQMAETVVERAVN